MPPIHENQNTKGVQQYEDRLMQLEEMVSHQAKTIEELSSIVARQWDEFDKARRKLDALTKRFLDLEEATAPGIEITKPPHY